MADPAFARLARLSASVSAAFNYAVCLCILSALEILSFFFLFLHIVPSFEETFVLEKSHVHMVLETGIIHTFFLYV